MTRLEVCRHKNPYMKIFALFLAMVQCAVIRDIQAEIEKIDKLEEQLERGKRDLIHWNRQHNNSYKLRSVHFSEMMNQESYNYLDQIKQFLAKQSDEKSRRISRRKRHGAQRP